MKVFLNYIHSFRGLAIIFIVAGHCIYAFNWDNNLLLRAILGRFINNGTVLFVFIAGYLFQHLSYKYDFKTYMKSKLNNVLLPYIIISVPAIVKAVFIAHDKGFDEYPKMLKIILLYVTGRHLEPLWFIPMIALFYVVSPLLIKLDKKNILYYSLPFFVIVSSIVPRNNLNIFQAFVHFISVYVGGMFCSRYREQTIKFTKKYFYPLVILFFLIFIADVYTTYTGSVLGFLNLWGKLLLCLLLINILQRFDAIVKDKFNYLAEISFGLYFLHAYVVSVFSKIIPDGSINGNIIFYSLYAFSAIAMTTLILFIAKKILGSRSRSIVGC
jgi:peptidoglycan/LPS O-acetylase OafA/YrhL